MSSISVLYLGGMALVFAGQRLFGDETISQVLTACGVLAVLGALGMRFAARGSAPTAAHKQAQGAALATMAIGAASLALYALSTDSAVAMLGLEDEAATRWSVPFMALWPIAFLVGTLPTIAIDLVLADSPVVLQPRRVQQARESWIVVALGISVVFPLNYLADEFNERWDLAYFKTTEAGDATKGVISTLSEPVVVRAFQAPASDVTPELEAYFGQLADPNISFEVVDHAAEPALTKELKVRDNGYIAVTLGEETKTWKVGTELDASKRNLKKLDTEFNKRLLELSRGKLTAYFTVGHGEMSWKGSLDPDRKLTQLKKVFEAQSFRVKELGLGQGLGDTIPDDAGVVVIIGPEEPFLDAEVAALGRYLDGGGSMMVMLEPDGEPLDGLLELVGLKRGEGILTSEKNYVRVSGGKSDRQNVVTNRFSSHGSTATLSKNSRALPMALPTSGFVEELDDFSKGKVTVTVRSMPDNWADLDGDLNYIQDKGEDKKIRSVAAVSSSGDEDGDYRAMVIGDATAFTDLVLASIKGNQVYIWDGLSWLTDQEEAAGEVESEEDVKIQHTREDQVAWFYGSSLGIPVVILLGGWLRVRSRSRKKAGAA